MLSRRSRRCNGLQERRAPYGRLQSFVNCAYAARDGRPPQRRADARRRGRRGRRLAGDRVARAGRQPARQREHAAARVGGRRAAALPAQPARALAAARGDDGGRARRARRRRGVLRERAEERAGRARGGRLPRARAQHRPRAPSASARRCGRCARTRSTGCWWRPPAATRTSACRRCSSTTCRRSPAPARWRWTTRPAIRLLVDHLVAVHGHERIAYLGPPEALGTGAGDCSRARAASGSRRSAPPSGAPACRCRRSTCARASRRASRRTARAAARELMALRAAADARSSAAPTTLAIGPAARAARRRAARAGRRRARVVRRAGARPTCSTRR